MKKSNGKVATVLVALALQAAFIGCAKSNPFGAVKVTGVVTLDGKPVDGATVVYQPAAGGGKAATGLTNASGNYTLTTHVAGDGAVPGSYKVAVSKTDAPKVADLSGLSPEEAAKKAQEEEMARMKANPSGVEKPRADLLPAKYKDADTSGLTFEVKQGQNNHFEIKLAK